MCEDCVLLRDLAGWLAGCVQDIKGGNVAMAMTLEAVRLLDPRLFETTSFHAWYNAAEEVGAADFAEICSSQLAESMPQEDLMACMVYEFDLSLGAGSDTAAGEVGHPVDELDEGTNTHTGPNQTTPFHSPAASFVHVQK